MVVRLNLVDVQRTARRRVLCLVAVIGGLLAVPFPANSTAADQDQVPAASSPEAISAQLQFFMLQVKPILERNCLRCHGATGTHKGGLRLTSRANILRGGDSGPAVSLERPAESLLVEAINYAGFEMPPSGKLPPAQIDVLTQWVRMGLPWPKEVSTLAAKPVSANHAGPPPVNQETRSFWSFQPVGHTAVPVVAPGDRADIPIDAFLAAKLHEAGMPFSRPAEKSAWLRRACYDLTGLPPEPQDVANFQADSSPGALERVVDRLLDSPHYGERWGRHWLDLVRYAESNSYERDGAKPFAWRYRDYVIRSFNDDKPYDQFIREQLAGDELSPVTPDGIIATGYYRLGIWDDEPADPEQALYDDLDDIVQTTGQVFLGLTIGCARCHDHKLDPIPQRDYYRFLAFFRNVRRYGVREHDSVLASSVRTIAQQEEQSLLAEKVKSHESRLRKLTEPLAALDARLKADLVGVEIDDFQTEAARIDLVRRRVPRLFTPEELERYGRLRKQIAALPDDKPAGLAQALCVKEHGRQAPPTHVLLRGNPHAPGDQVQPGFPSVLDPPAPDIVELDSAIESSGRRAALARWLADPSNPLTARVMVNRIWQHHFGRGIVRSASDFGFQGTPPTHPELLDWLAAEFVAGGWRIKRLHKLIMLSRAYQMSSVGEAATVARDPENNLFWRYNPRRLSAEEVRDSILAVNASLNRASLYGPSIYVRIPAEVHAGQSRPGDGWGKSTPADENRRSIYIHVKRSLLTPILTSFDAADTDSSCPVRFVTTQPTQALGMLNSEFLQEQAGVFAQFVRTRTGDDSSAQAALVLERVLQRTPTSVEITRAVQFLETMRARHQLDSQAALRYLCLLALNLNEFVYLD